MRKLSISLLIGISTMLGSYAQTNTAAFFRISSPPNAWITDFDPVAGTISWSNDVAGVTNQLQRAYVLNGVSNWIDFVQLVSTNGSQTGTERIIDLDPPEGMVLIPGGAFQMGDMFGEGHNDELPVHDVYTSGFYMDKYEVTNDEMVEVMQWAYDNGKLTVSSSSVKNAQGNQQELLDLDNSIGRITWNGSTFGIKPERGSGYPCLYVSWYGAVAYCNYRSEMEGRTPCYNLSEWRCNWSNNGYRLPSEAEWEKAARGGQNGKRFSWGNTINHDYANYKANGSAFSYDASPYTSPTYHPLYDDGYYPYTSPVRAFDANAYGVHNMVGNVWEWCWDWKNDGYYARSPYMNPTGASSGWGRSKRGGGWTSDALHCRPADRDSNDPAQTSGAFGFRTVHNAN